jgi:hypothetical protein
MTEIKEREKQKAILSICKYIRLKLETHREMGMKGAELAKAVN